MYFLVVSLYAVPILKIVTSHINCRALFRLINKPLGFIEFFLSPIRDFILSPLLFVVVVFLVWSAIKFKTYEDAIIATVLTLTITSSIVGRIGRKKWIVTYTKFAGTIAPIHPRDFFSYYIRMFGPFSPSYRKEDFSILNPTKIDFTKKGMGFVGPIKLLTGLLNTVSITRLILLASKHTCDDKSELHRIASSLVMVWGARICELARLGVTVDYKPQNTLAKTARIYLFTHKSFLDFAVAPFAIAATNPKDSDHINCLPRFLVAKDHFKNNFIYYRVLGLGRVAELLGMIFVDRSSKNKSLAPKIGEEASRLLRTSSIPIAIFPQGTRAWPFKSPAKDRLDAAYYTVGSLSRLEKEASHLKKGAAHIAAQTIKSFALTNTKAFVEIIPVSITGTATACPKGSAILRPNTQIKLTVGNSVTAGPDLLLVSQDTAVGTLHAKIDLALKNTERVHTELERRFFEFMRPSLEGGKFEEISVAMKSFRGNDYLVFSIIDAIFACNPKKWRLLFTELINMISNFSTRDDFVEFKKKVAREVVQSSSPL